MGRVRRYKKLKACDPCARGQAPREEDAKYDLPPAGLDSDEEKGGGKKRRRQERQWAQDALRDDEYIEMLENEATRKRKKQLPEISIQPRQPNESMKAFQHRVRQDSKALLRESNMANSTTKARRREYLRIRKANKKRKAQGLPPLPHRSRGQEECDGREHQGGLMDPAPSFAAAETVPFGQTNAAPPDLRLPRLPDKLKAGARPIDGRHGQAPQRPGGRRQEQKAKESGEKEGPVAKAAAARAKQSPAEKADWAKLREEAQQAYRAMKEGKQQQELTSKFV